jgi:glycosyltransferase involved in cell wall biosynthesis
MKVIHCLNHFLPHQIAGTEIYTLSLIKSLWQFGVESLVVIPNYGIEEDEEYVFDEIKVIKYGEPSIVDRSLIMGKRVPDGLKRFLQILQKEQPDIVQFHEITGSNGITVNHVIRAKQLGFRTVMTFHLAGYSCKVGSLMYKSQIPCEGIIQTGKCTFCSNHAQKISSLQAYLLHGAYLITDIFHYDSTRWNNRLGTAIGFPTIIKQLKYKLEQLINHCDKSVVIAQWYQSVLEKNNFSKDKIKYIAQALPNIQNKCTIITDDTGIHSDNRLKIVFVGRISPIKGVDLLIDAICQLPKELVLLSIYGKGDGTNYILQCKNRTERYQNILWKGILNPEEVVDTMKEYDILCLPSSVCEMSPLVIQEAYAAGIPVLASNVYGNAEQIQDGVNGWLFKFKDSQDLTNKLRFLIDNPQAIEKAKKHIPKVRAFDEVAEEYCQLYNSIIHID